MVTLGIFVYLHKGAKYFSSGPSTQSVKTSFYEYEFCRIMRTVISPFTLLIGP